MNIQRIKVLAWLGAAITGGALGWEVVDFVQRRPELQAMLPSETARRVLEEVVTPPPPDDTRVSVDSVNRVFHEMNWSGAKDVEPVEIVQGPEEEPVRRTPVADLLKVLAIQEDGRHPERSVAFVQFTDPALKQLRREPRLHLLHVGERLGGAHESVRVESIKTEGVLFAFDEEGREPELLLPEPYDAEGAAIVAVAEGQVILPQGEKLIPRNGDYRWEPPRQTERIRRDEFYIGSDEIEDLDRNYSEILSRDVSYRSARGSDGKVIGIQVTRVAPNSLPARAGLEAGEVLKSINGQSVKSVNEAVVYVKQAAKTTNTWVAVFERQGREYTRTYTSPPSE